MTVRLLSTLALFCTVLTASCVQSPESSTEAGAGEAQSSAGTETSTARETTGEAQAPCPTAHDPEPIGEAAQRWTRADCYTAWKHNGMLCNSSPPNLRLACYAAVAGILTACLAGAQG
jgi:hypothetical protein